MTDWIETAKRYPPDLTPVLGFNATKSSPYAICYRQKRDDGNIWSWNGTSCHERLEKYCIVPTHWRPLPNPPTPDKNTD